ncbi:hypothetical protein DFP72DRAFT_1101059 [Ephemerocybe angulata]|uniref:C2H2-type domain-containing protein n=1 Tax=Ephemerocybe angulata TaxID=980116 RepID=A0A8H6I635_9AGAR|nr:hypothetical protein DFP72DRAFT_1101059 [Tulosesus angulatus]
MRVSLFAILPIVLALASTATAYYDDDFETRDYIDDLATRDYGDNVLGARHLLIDISTRDLVDELTRRAPKYKCSCGATFSDLTKLWQPKIQKHFTTRIRKDRVAHSPNPRTYI